MRRFLVTSPSFTGEAELIYDASDRLITMNVGNTNMTPFIISHFKSLAACDVSGIAGAFENTKATIVEADFEVTIEDFLKEYPYKRNTHLTREYWPRLTKTEQVQAYMAAKEYAKYCTRNIRWYNAKIAVAWLKSKEFLNEWNKM